MQSPQNKGLEVERLIHFLWEMVDFGDQGDQDVFPETVKFFISLYLDLSWNVGMLWNVDQFSYFRMFWIAMSLGYGQVLAIFLGGTFGNSTRDGKGPPSDNAVPEASFLNSV